jgi:predicted nucleic acid-binding protein
MNRVDSSGWPEYFANGRNANFFAPAIEATENLLVPTICILEFFKRMLQQRGEREALRAAAHMSLARVSELDGTIALSAGKLGCELKLPLADSVILATAREPGANLWTQNADFKGIKV